MTNYDSKEEAEYYKKSDGDEKDEVGKSFKAKPVGQCGERFWEDGD